MVRWCWVNFQRRGVLLIWITVGQGPIALTVGAGGVVWTFFSLVYYFSYLSPSLWVTARYRLKYCLKGPLSPKQSITQLNLVPNYLHDSRTRAFCACSRCGWGLFGHFYSQLSFLLFLPLFGRRPDID